MLDAAVADPCIPGYRIVSPLGDGGMATVYLAVQESLDRDVALKVLAPAMAANQEFASRFLKEGRITARLNHPHLVTVFDIGQHGAIYYLAAEYLPGGTLREKLDRGISIAESLDAICDVAKGLHFAHNAGFVHRDVKPSNVMFRANGAAVLADFGIAKSMDGKTMVTQVGSWIGTPRYMSPEQVNAQAVDGRSDLYSLGVVLFELLTGQPPYVAGDPLTVALMHVSHPLPQLPPALAWLQPLIDGLMAKDASERFATGEAFVAAVEQLWDHAPDAMALQNAADTSKRAAPRFSPADRQQPSARSQTTSDALPAPQHASSEPTTSTPPARQRRIVMITIIAALAVLGGGAAAWMTFVSRDSAARAQIDDLCRAAMASVTTAIGQADLTQAQAKFAALPNPCSAHPQASQTRDTVNAAAERAAAARKLLVAALDRGDVPGARHALGSLEGIDRSANDLPDLRNRLDQAHAKTTGDQKVVAIPAPEITPPAPVRQAIPPNATEPAPPEPTPLRRPPADGSATVRRPTANPSGQQSQKCREISLRAGLGEETAEERRYISENCR